MPYKKVCIRAIILLSFCVIVWTFAYGPAKRKFVLPDKVVTLRSAYELDSLWHTSGVHGRVAVLFARHMSQPFSLKTFPEMDYLDSAMNHGIVRTAYYIVPDRMWTEVIANNVENPSLIVQPKIIDPGYYILLHEGGRIHVIRFSKFIPEQEGEKSLVVIEPAIWDSEEQGRIEGFIKSGQISSDLTVIVSKPKQHQ